MTGSFLAGFREREHTADWALDVWARDLPELLQTAAAGMYALMGVELLPGGEAQHRRLDLPAGDDETILVGFLSELLYLLGTQGLLFDQIRLEPHGELWRADMVGRPVDRVAKEIKAVTYHQLAIRPVDGHLETTIVFDV